MAQSGYTPIQLYYSTTAAAAPTAGNLTSGELALNIQDEKLYFKNAAGVVKLLASNATTTNVTSFQTSLGGLTPSTATTGVVTLAGTLDTSSGGTGLTSFTAGDLPYYATGTTLSKLGIGSSGYFLSSSGTAPQWTQTLGVANGGTGLTTTPANGALDIGNGTGFTRTTLTAGTGISITNASGSITIASTAAGTVSSVDVSGGTTGLTTSGGPITTSGTITLAGTLAIANGGTGQTTAAAALTALGGINTGKSIAMAMIFGG